MYLALEAFLLRAPLLAEREVADAGRGFERHALHEMALGLASAGLGAAGDSAGRRRALERYGRRAAFRATPHTLLAGVCMGELAERTVIATGEPIAHLAPAWQQMAALGRALLDEPEARARVRLRVAPSLMRGATALRWLGPGEPFGYERQASLDGRLAALLDATTSWCPWTEVREAVRERGTGAAEVDDWLLVLVDEGLLHADVTPPLIGPPAGVWMRGRLRELGRSDEAATLETALGALAAGDLGRGRAALEGLPAPLTEPAVHAVLTHRPRRAPALAREAVERAAGLAPLLFRLQEALVPPGGERLGQAALVDALDAATELFGAGALDLEALAAGDYGVDAAGGDAATPQAPAPPPVLTALLDAIHEAVANGADEARLDLEALEAALDGLGAAPPPTCELFLTPMRTARQAPAGTGWLLGLHAPAGASWGRFAAALGAPLDEALATLAGAERDARPLEERLDVAFAPAPGLADLCAHPPIRARALALSTWSDQREAHDGAGAPRTADLVPRHLELVADPGALAPLALRDRASRQPVAPSPLSRVRSTTAPPGVTRLLVGWSLQRQHAPWALALGPLAALAHVPRLSLEGFVIAPASWRLPPALGDGQAPQAALARWRRDHGVPRWIQVGHEDQLLPVDLHSAGALADLRGQARVWEIWPPLGRTVDRDGRRVEASVALVDEDEAQEQSRADQQTQAAGRVPPPRAAPATPGWRTVKVFGAAEHQDQVLANDLVPAVRAALRARQLDGWFFQRYVDGPGQRPHLRLRTRASTARGRAAFDRRLTAALEPARAAGAVVTVEGTDYHPEWARFGEALDAVHAVFQSDSALVVDLLGQPEPSDEPSSDDDARGGDLLVLAVRSLDALARGLGLELRARHDLARSRREAEMGGAPADPAARAEADAAFRTRAPLLRVALAAPASAPRDAAARALRAHVAATGRATRRLSAATRLRLAPALLHLACVRLAGPDRALERLAYTCWQRALEGLLRSPVRAAVRAAARPASGS